jgi:flagellar L-ring protein precursor FlgH
MLIRITFIALFLQMSGCASVPREKSAETDFTLYYPEESANEPIKTGAIYANGTNLFPTRRMYMAGEVKVGDIITVVLNESAQASRNTGLTAERTTENDVIGANQAAAITPGGQFFNGINTAGSTLSSTGTGTANQSASLWGSISAVVVDVMANGNLVILGEKRLTLSEGSEIIRVRGVVRPEDVQPNNTINSRRIANAQFSYSGTGELSRAVKQPGGQRVIMGIWPF